MITKKGYCFSIMFFLIAISSNVFAQQKTDTEKTYHVLVDIPIENGVALYYSCNKTGKYQIYKKVGLQETLIINDPTSNYWGISISPDRKKFVCYKAKSYDEKESELWLYSIDGKKSRRLFTLRDNDWKSQRAASWSPDGTKLIMSAEGKDERDRGKYNSHIYVTEVTLDFDPKPIQLTKASTHFQDPAFSPDGKKIVFSGQPEGAGGLFTKKEMELFVADFNAADNSISNIKTITSNNIWDGMPIYSLDGESIYYGVAVGMISDIEYIDINKISPEGNITPVKVDKAVKANLTMAPTGTLYFIYRPSLSGDFSIAKMTDNGAEFSIIAQGLGYSFLNPVAIEAPIE